MDPERAGLTDVSVAWRCTGLPIIMRQGLSNWGGATDAVGRNTFLAGDDTKDEEYTREISRVR